MAAASATTEGVEDMFCAKRGLPPKLLKSTERSQKCEMLGTLLPAVSKNYFFLPKHRQKRSIH